MMFSFFSMAVRPTKKDVLMGQNHALSKHPMKKFYQELVSNVADQYFASNKAGKAALIAGVIAAVSQEGGRFLKSTSAIEKNFLVDTKWTVASDQIIRDKVASNLRNKARNNRTKAAAKPRSIRWCWQESPAMMRQWTDDDIEGDRKDCWIKYEDISTMVLEDAYQENPIHGSCVPMHGYTVYWENGDDMRQVKDLTGFERKVKRIEVFAAFEPGANVLVQPLAVLPTASGVPVLSELGAPVRPAVWLGDPPVVEATVIAVETMVTATPVYE